MIEPAADPAIPVRTANGEGPSPVPTDAPAEEPLAGAPQPAPPPAVESPASPVVHKPTTQLAPPGEEPAHEASPTVPPPPHSLSLEERVRRLEDAMAQLQDVRGIETRVAERVAIRLTRAQPVATLAVSVPSAPVPSPVATPVPAPAPVRPAPTGHRWLVLETLAQGRAILRMLFDRRYQLSWGTRILALALAAAILTSYFWLPFTSIPIFGTLFDKTVDLILAFILFKVLGHEAQRYRMTASDLPTALRP